MPTLVDFRSVAETAARAGGAVLLDWMGKFQVREKGPADLVTEADVGSQQAIQQVLLGAFPRHGFLAEENVSIPSGDEGLRWIVDPLDGTTNYVHGIPAFAVSIALEQHGTLLAGVIYDPIADACFSAAVGQGATLNDRPLRVSGVERLDRAVIASSLPPKLARHSPPLREFIEVSLVTQSVRRIGSAALNLAFLAAGRFDAYWSSHVHVWDVAAGVLLVNEAGGIVTSSDGSPFTLSPPHLCAAASPQLHGDIRRLLASLHGSRHSEDFEPERVDSDRIE